MSSVLPINTQRYESGDYILEVTAHQSPLSQWSDKSVVRQLRFNLWSNQPTRKCLLAGDQQQLVTLSDTVESYVQRHLTHEAWPSNHHLQLLDQDIELSTLQLFNLAEVFNAYGQQQIILPAAKSQPRQRRRWWTGSSVAAFIAAVGVATAYLQYRPAAFNQTETAQVPKAVFEQEAGSSAIVPDNAASDAVPEAQSAPAADSPEISSSAETESLESRVSTNADLPRLTEFPQDNSLQENQARRQTEESESFSDAVSPTTSPLSQAPTIARPEPVATASEPLPAERQEESVAAPPSPAPTASSEISALPESAEEATSIITAEAMEEPFELDDDASTDADAVVSADEEFTTTARISGNQANGVLDAISTQLAPYQPTGINYPLVYHLIIAPDGTITTVEPISEKAPAISPSVINPAPGRSLRVELIYNGNDRPVVNELFE